MSCGQIRYFTVFRDKRQKEVCSNCKRISWSCWKSTVFAVFTHIGITCPCRQLSETKQRNHQYPQFNAKADWTDANTNKPNATAYTRHNTSRTASTHPSNELWRRSTETDNIKNIRLVNSLRRGAERLHWRGSFKQTLALKSCNARTCS